MIKDKEERFCGNCCWFKFEVTDGWGCCYSPAKPLNNDKLDFCNCALPVKKDANCGYVSVSLMRHYMAVMLQYTRWLNDHEELRYAPNCNDLDEAIAFSYKYMKAFYRI